MRILILEKDEYVRYSLEKALNEIEPNVALAPEDFDYENIVEWMRYIERLMPTAVLYRGGVHSVHAGEKNVNHCFCLNADVTRMLMKACRNVDSEFIYMSSIQVFNGKKDAPYDERDLTCPINGYGKSKAKGEAIAREYEKTYIIRPGWLYGYYNDFIYKELIKAKQNKKLNLNCNIYSNPIYIKDLAFDIYTMLLKQEHKTYHFYNDGFASKAEIIKYVLNTFRMDANIEEIDSSETYDSRFYPEDLRLTTIYDSDLLNRDWHDAMNEYLFNILKDEKILILKK